MRQGPLFIREEEVQSGEEKGQGLRRDKSLVYRGALEAHWKTFSFFSSPHETRLFVLSHIYFSLPLPLTIHIIIYLCSTRPPLSNSPLPQSSDIM
jgi:hypothetical protein